MKPKRYNPLLLNLVKVAKERRSLGMAWAAALRLELADDPEAADELREWAITNCEGVK